MANVPQIAGPADPRRPRTLGRARGTGRTRRADAPARPRGWAVTLHRLIAALLAAALVGLAAFAVDGAVEESVEGYLVPVEPAAVGPDGRMEELTWRTVYPTVGEGLALRIDPLLGTFCGLLFFIAAAELVRRGRLIAPLRRLYAGATALAGLAALGLLIGGATFASMGGWGLVAGFGTLLYAIAALVVGLAFLLLSRALRGPADAPRPAGRRVPIRR